MKVLGRIIKCMEKVNLFGQIEGLMKENIAMIKSMDMASFNGLTKEDMKVIGLMESNMEKEFTLQLQGNQKKENGKMERELDGYTKKMIVNQLMLLSTNYFFIMEISNIQLTIYFKL